MDIQVILNIGIALAVIGILLLITSNVMYYKRTKDKGYIKRFWLKKEILTKNEYILNRVGFSLSYGVVTAFVIFIIVNTTTHT